MSPSTAEFQKGPNSSASWLPAALARWVALVLFAITEAYFLVYFRESRWQPTVDAAWAVAVICWFIAFWRADTSSQSRLRHPYWFYVLYVVALVPFATNWRWVMSADSLGWAFGGLHLAEHGPMASLLSLHGVGQFGYGQLALHDVFMVLVRPTLFWHRFGQIITGLLSLAAIYTVAARLVAPSFGLLVAACAMSTSIMIVHTLCSYPLLDAIACGYAIVAAGLWVHRQPESRRAWLALGFLSGFMLFLTPNSWAMGFCVWGWLGVVILWRRWGWSNPALSVATAVIVGLPVLIQFVMGQGGELFTQVQHPGWTVEKVTRFFWEGATIPFRSEMRSAGAFGPQLPQGFRYFYVLGALVTPIFGRRFPGARLMLYLLAANLLLLALTQGPYPNVSVKRALILIPMATFFVFLPFHHYLRSPVIVLPLIAAWASFGVYDVVARIQPGRTGFNFIDGVIEAHQRFSGVPVCIVITNRQYAAVVEPGNDLDRLYGLSSHLKYVRDPTDAACNHTLCYSSQVESVDLKALGYAEIEMLGTVELRCGRKLPP